MPKNRVQELRKANGISRPGLADRMGVSEATVRVWETGRGGIPIQKAARLSDLFGVSLEHLLGLDRCQGSCEQHDGEECA
jgi:transcriptional regulator with XRE-family HTH domain